MPCYHPLNAWMLHGKTSNAVYFSLDKCPYPSSYLTPIKLPCGQCIGCRLERSRQWAMRCMFELRYHKRSSFVTLTYDDDHLPPDSTLVKRDYQLFVKRLRKAYPDIKIRYLACGEYGDRTQRPHYHAILYGVDFTMDLTPVYVAGNKKAYVNQKLLNIWGLGHAFAGKVTFESCAYVARYCLKKVNGPAADEYYHGRQPEFILCSRRPGLGAQFYEEYACQIQEQDAVYTRDARRTKPPRYYDKLTERIDAQLLHDIKDRRLSSKIIDLTNDDLARIEACVLDRQKRHQKKL